jgi:hypothetical protein
LQLILDCGSSIGEQTKLRVKETPILQASKLGILFDE